MQSIQKLELCWQDCFVLLNVAQYLNGENIYLLKSSITECSSHSDNSLDGMFDDVVKQLVSQRLAEFDQNKNAKLFEMTIYFIKQTNTAKYIQKRNNFYWIYDMIGAKEPSLNLIDSSGYNDMGSTDWHRDDHRTFLTKEIFASGNVFLIVNILKFIKINNYSLTNSRVGSCVNQIDKILLKLILSFGKSLKKSLPKCEQSEFIKYNTKFLEFAYFYLHNYIPHMRHKHFLHILLNRAIRRGHIECVKMLRNKCKAPMIIPNIFVTEQKLFETFRTAQHCMTIWGLMLYNFDIKLVLCLKACYNVDEINENELLDMGKLKKIVSNFMKQSQCDQIIQNGENEEILSFWQLLKDKHNILKDKACVNFVEMQIEATKQQM